MPAKMTLPTVSQATMDRLLELKAGKTLTNREIGRLLGLHEEYVKQLWVWMRKHDPRAKAVGRKTPGVPKGVYTGRIPDLDVPKPTGDPDEAGWDFSGENVENPKM